MNRAFFMKNFKGYPEATYIINGDLVALSWLSHRLKHVVSSTANNVMSIGDGDPFSGSSTVDLIINNDLDEPEFRLFDQNRYRLAISRTRFIELYSKLDGIIEFEKPSHNYLDIGSGGVSRIFITTGEYPDSVLSRMMEDEDRRGIGEAR